MGDVTAVKHPLVYIDGEATYQPPPKWKPLPMPKEAQLFMRALRELPASDRMVVYEPPLREQKTEGGIILPDVAEDNSTNKSHIVWIMACGPDACAQGFEAGQSVRVSQYAGVRMKGKTEEKTSPLCYLKADDVLGKVYEE